MEQDPFNELTTKQKIMMILFPHKQQDSLFTILPIELVKIISGLSRVSVATDSEFKYSLRFPKDKERNNVIYKPSGLTLDPNSKRIYATSNNRVKVLEKKKDDFSLLFEFSGKLYYPTGIDISNNGQKIYVCDGYKRELQIFNNTGNFLSSHPNNSKVVGTPHHLSVSENDNIFMTMHTTSTILVFNENGDHLYSFDDYGPTSTKVELVGILVSKKSDKVFVSDFVNHEIHVFSQNGQFLFSFGKNFSSERKIFNPLGMCADREGNLFVADSDNHRIQIFDETGNFLVCFGSDESSPTDLICDNDGNVFVSDSENDCIHLWNYY